MIRPVKFLVKNRKLCLYVFCILLPFILSPLAASSDKESKCAFVIILVASYWLLEPIPIAATSLLPVVLLPTLGVVNSSEVCENYMKESFMMFIGGLIVAIAVENSMLHERIALRVLLLVGTEIKWLMMGFMLTTMMLSMWISNTATTAMMVPIVEAVVEEMTSTSKADDDEISLKEFNGQISNDPLVPDAENEADVRTKISSSKPQKNSVIKTCILLSICYAANIGGTGTLTGTGPNLVLKGLMEEIHPGSNEITFATWMLYNVPGMLLCVLIGWFYLYIVYIRCANAANNLESKGKIKKIILKRYQNLGPFNFQQTAVVVLFVSLVFLWTFRDPKFITGWAIAINSELGIGDSVPAIGAAFLLFFVPSNPRDFGNSPSLLEWKTAEKKIPWGIIILAGGGFALANAAQKSGLSSLIGNKLSSLSVLPAGAIAAVICFMTAMLTEVVTNTTAATILLPVFSQMALVIGVNPLFLMLPVTVTCSYAFMLPAATPPNAIVFESGNMRTIDMAKPGLVMNLVCCGVQLFMINTLGVSMFKLNTFPDWANRTNDVMTTNDTHIFFNETDLL